MNEKLKDFRHKLHIPIRYSDIDMLQHVNNAKYLNFLEEARVDYAKTIFQWDGQAHTLGMILANVKIDFLQPVFLFEELWLYTRCVKMGTKSFDLEYIFWRENTNPGPCATAFTTLVCYDLIQQKSITIPEEMRSKVIEFEPSLSKITL